MTRDMPFTPLPSLREISQRCGVAKSTVGHILGGRSHLFRPETRELVLRAAEELGWKRPEDWRSVRRARFGCAILLQGLDMSRSLIGPNLLSGLEDRLLDRNMHLTLARLPDETMASETALKRLLQQWSADGMIITYTQRPPPRLRALVTELELPVVWLNTRQEPMDSVRPDDTGAGRRAAELLLEAGHRNVSYLTYSMPTTETVEDLHYSMIDRPAAARAAVINAGGTWTDVAGPDCMSIPRWKDRLSKPDRETAVIAYNPIQALPVLHAALVLGLRVPEDLSLITFHHEPVWMLDRDIASLELPEAAMAEKAAAHLCARIAGGPSMALDPEPFTVRSTATIAPPPALRPSRTRPSRAKSR